MDMNQESLENQGIDTLPLYRVQLCGSFCLQRRVDNTYVVVDTKEWGGHRSPRTLLKALLCALGRRASRGTLLTQLWPEADGEQANRELNVAVSRARKILSSVGQQECLRTEQDAGGFSLASQATVWVDVDAALALLDEADSHGQQSRETVSLLENALTYFQRGAFLEDEGGEWVDNKRAIVERRRYRCQRWLAEAYASQDTFGQAETVLNTLLGEDPTDEDVICQLMALLHQYGLTHQALVLYNQTRAFFAKEGLEFSETTLRIATQLRKEPMLSSKSPGVLEKRGPFSPFLLSSTIPSLFSENLPSLPTMEPHSPLFETDTDVLLRLSTVLNPSSSVGTREISYFDEQLRLYWRVREETLLSASSLYGSVVRHIHHLTFLLARSHLSDLRLHLCETASRAILLAGVLLYDMGHYTRARQCYQIAFQAASEANSFILQAIVWGWMSFTWTYEQQYVQALHCIQRAHHLVTQSHAPIVQAWLGAIEAEIQAHLCNREACQVLLATTEQILETAPSLDTSYLFEFHPVLFLGYKGICLQQFYERQDPTTHTFLREAKEALEQALTSETPVKRHLYYLTDLAAIQARQGDIEAACGALERNLPSILSTGNGSKTLQKHLLQVHTLLRPYKHEGIVQELDESIAPLLLEKEEKKR